MGKSRNTYVISEIHFKLHNRDQSDLVSLGFNNMYVSTVENDFAAHEEGCASTMSERSNSAHARSRDEL